MHERSVCQNAIDRKKKAIITACITHVAEFRNSCIIVTRFPLGMLRRRSEKVNVERERERETYPSQSQFVAPPAYILHIIVCCTIRTEKMTLMMR